MSVTPHEPTGNEPSRRARAGSPATPRGWRAVFGALLLEDAEVFDRLARAGKHEPSQPPGGGCAPLRPPP